jgi:preprotein translocase subunit SecD
MFKNISTRWFVIVLLLLFVSYRLWPSYNFLTLSEKDKELMKKNDLSQYEKLSKNSINLGLDLQGGMHVVLEADVPNLVKKLANNKSPELLNAINESEKRSINNQTDFFDEFNLIVEQDSIPLKRLYSSLISSSRNTDVLDELKKQTENSLNSVLEIIRNRIDQFGVSEPNIQKSGNRRIIVELAGVKDPERARKLIQSTALLEFSIVKEIEQQQSLFSSIDELILQDNLILAKEEAEKVDIANPDSSSEDVLKGLFDEEDTFDNNLNELNLFKTSDELLQERPFSAYLKAFPGGVGVIESEYNSVKSILELQQIKDIIPNDGRLLWANKASSVNLEDGSLINFRNLYYVNRVSELTGGVIQEASANYGATGTNASGLPIVNLTMNSVGTKKWSISTGANVGRSVAIILDGNVFIAPVIRDKIPNGMTQITGLDDVDEAKDIANVLRAGALPTPVQIIEERTVGPSLGKDSIQSGQKAMMYGFILVIIFMIFYYKFSGILANLALVINILFILTVLVSLGATLTLPGIAGLILTIGMTVDANVIIFERIREELDNGKTVKGAIRSGYDRAFKTILDANLTTLIAAAVLLGVGSGPIKGFAVTLSIGILSSMFCAIFITRTFFMTLTKNKILKSLSI